MEALEDEILRGIVRGDDNDDVRHDEHDSAEEEDEDADPHAGPDTDVMPPTMGGPGAMQMRPHNTGVKGVLQDYRDMTRRVEERRAEQTRSFWDKAYKNSMATRGDGAPQPKQPGEEDDSDIDLDDDDILASYKARRVAELQSGGP